MEIDIINDTMTPITDEMFEKQGWEKHEQSDEEEKFYYWTLSLPKDNPDKSAPCLISTTNDDWDYLGLEKGTYVVEIFNFYGLGSCGCVEEVEDLYSVLTGEDIYE